MNSKVALVTGAGKRIGQAIAIHLAECGYDIVVHYLTSGAGAKETKENIEKLGRRALLVQSDLSDVTAPREIIENIRSFFGRLDIVVNSASTFPEPDKLRAKHFFYEESEREWDKAISVNTRAPFFLIKYAAPFLAESKNGLVINILDRSAFELTPSRSAHALSKNTLKAITDLGAKSFSDFRICSLLLGEILPGDDMSAELASQFKWIGIEPVLRKLSEIINDDQSGKHYLVP